MKQTLNNHMIMLAVLLALLAGPLLAGRAHAEGATLAVTAADSSIYYGLGSTTSISATLQLEGQPVSGALVRFALRSGAGTLSAAEATTDDVGQAQVSFTAPENLAAGRVVVVQATYTTPEQTTTSGATTLFLGSAAEFAELKTVETLAGKQLISPARMGVDVVKRGAGTPVVGLGTFASDPYQTLCKAEPGPPDIGPALLCTRSSAAAFKPDTAFYLAHLSSTAGVDSLEVRIRYRGDRNEKSMRLFWHDATGWRAVRGASVDTRANEVRFVFTATSTPSLSQVASGQFGLVVGH